MEAELPQYQEVSTGTRIPGTHDYAVVEIVSDDASGIRFRVVCSADAKGLRSVWPEIQASHPRAKSLRIMDAREAEKGMRKSLEELSLN